MSHHHHGHHHHDDHGGTSFSFLSLLRGAKKHCVMCLRKYRLPPHPNAKEMIHQCKDQANLADCVNKKLAEL